MRESLLLATIHEATLDFLRGRKDVVLFGAYAVNAYVGEPRMTQDIDLLATDARSLVEELQAFLNEKFHIAVRTHEVGDSGWRIYQARKEGSCHLVDVRLVVAFPATQLIEDIQILSPLELIAAKIIAYHARRGRPKSGTDWRDIAMLLLEFPSLKAEVTQTLQTKNVGAAVLQTWAEIENQEFRSENEDDDLLF